METLPTLSARTDRLQMLKAAAALGVLGQGAAGIPRVMATLSNPESDAKEVATLLSTEPALSARVLRVANSPYYGQARAITSVDRALVVLGLNAVRGIAAAACLDRTANRGPLQKTLDLASVVRHSLATGLAAESIALSRQPALAGEAFIAGLLHNFGVFVQLSLDHPGIEAMIAARRAGDRRDMRTLEAERAAVGHEDCAAALFEAWQMPIALIAVVRDHHDPMAAQEPHRLLASLVHVGNQLALESGTAFSLEPGSGPRTPAPMELLELSDSDLDDIVRELPMRVAALHGALGH